MDQAVQLRASAWSAEFTRPDQMAQLQRDAQLEYQALVGSAGYAGRVTAVELGAMRFEDVRDSPHIVRGRIAAGRMAILFAAREGGEGPRINGFRGWQQGGALLRGGAELMGGSAVPLRWFGLIVAEQRFADVLDRLPACAGGFHALEALQRQSPQLLSLARTLGDVARRDPARLAAGTASAALDDELTTCIRAGIGTAGDGLLRHRALARRVRLVARAEDFLATRLGTPVYSPEVSANLGVSERLLAEAFIGVYGMSLQRYLLVRRLNAARRALMARNDGVMLVKTVALDLGFWNFGRFSRAYSTIFGESPSTTARNSIRHDPRHKAADIHGNGSLNKARCLGAGIIPAIVGPVVDKVRSSDTSIEGA